MKFRFTIRDLLWLTALVAVLVAWWVDHQRSDTAMRDMQMGVADLKQKLSKMQIYLNGQPAPAYHSIVDPFKVQAERASAASR